MCRLVYDPFPYVGAVYFYCRKCWAISTIRRVDEFRRCKRCKSADVRFSVISRCDLREMNAAAQRWSHLLPGSPGDP